MISDDPDEDADTLDDDNLLAGFLAPCSPRSESDAAARLLDWPSHRTQDANPILDVATLAWFKENHADWRSAINDVLRSWIDARARTAAGLVTPA